MADEGNVKTTLGALQDTLSRLKEMAHYSQTNIEKLATLWLDVSAPAALATGGASPEGELVSIG